MVLCTLFHSIYSHRLNALQGHSLQALRNLISALPPSGWGGGDGMAAMWSSLLTLLEAGGEFLHGEAIAGALMVLIEKLNTLGVEVSWWKMYATWEFILLHYNKPTHTYAHTHTRSVWQWSSFSWYHSLHCQVAKTPMWGQTSWQYWEQLVGWHWKTSSLDYGCWVYASCIWNNSCIFTYLIHSP